MKIILTGGGTAGHVTPHLAIIPRLMQDGWEVHYVGTENGMERDIMGKVAGITYHAIPAGKLRRYLSSKNITDIGKTLKGHSSPVMPVISSLSSV